MIYLQKVVQFLKKRKRIRMDQQNTILFPKEEKVGYHQGNNVIIFSVNSILIEHNLIFPFPVLFYSLPFDDETHILLVNLDDPTSLILWNIKIMKEESIQKFDSNIQNFLYSGSFSCVIMEETTVILNSRTLVIHQVIETSSSLSTFALVQTPSDVDHCIFVYANDMRMNSVTVMTIPSSTPSVIFEAHKSPIRFVALSNNGKYIATVSIKGTIIRLWSINGQLLKESRRGLTPAVIVHMSFSPCSEFLCVSSNHFTAHIFKIDDKIQNDVNGNKNIIENRTNHTSSGINSWLSFLPKANITVSVQDAKMFSSFVLTGGNILCTVTDKGVCNIYDIDLTSNKCTFKSKIVIPNIARIASSKQNIK